MANYFLVRQRGGHLILAKGGYEKDMASLDKPFFVCVDSVLVRNRIKVLPKKLKLYLYTCMHTFIAVTLLVRVISISDEVYSELSRIKDGMSFTELIKTLISQCQSRGDAKTILAFLEKKEPLSEESEKNITDTLEKSRKTAIARKLKNSK